MTPIHYKVWSICGYVHCFAHASHDKGVCCSVALLYGPDGAIVKEYNSITGEKRTLKASEVKEAAIWG